ncbi:MAG: amino acid ABC transporter substrate-binding protein [Ruminococcaceae bacterium]|nr:amino acid ABC transporter substrate-binding protein [Oscillospiraceae bacterium]
MKKNLIKSLALVMAGIMSAGMLAGCGGKGDDVLTMATNATFPPYEFYENEKIVGIDAEIAEAIAGKIGMTLEIVDTEFGSIVAGVQTGKYDMGMAGMTVTDERKQSVDFTTSYATGIQSIVVKEGSPIQSLDDLAGKKIGVQQDTTGHIYAADEFGDEMVLPFNKGTDAIAALVSDKVDCVIIDNQPAKSFVEANEGLVILETNYATEDYAIAISKENTELLEKVNAALEELIADGTVETIINKYISAE